MKNKLFFILDQNAELRWTNLNLYWLTGILKALLKALIGYSILNCKISSRLLLCGRSRISVYFEKKSPVLYF